MAIINLILCIVAILIGAQYEGKVLVGFIIGGVSFIFLMGSNIIILVKGIIFGDKYATQNEAPLEVKDKKIFNVMSTIVGVFFALFFVFFVVGLILILF